MPHIDWKNLPRGVRQHLQDRSRTREISKEDLLKLAEWIGGNPEVPEGSWCKDFGSFKLVGEGRYPKTFLTKQQAFFGKML
jgi:hypothetical protein